MLGAKGVLFHKQIISAAAKSSLLAGLHIDWRKFMSDMLLGVEAATADHDFLLALLVQQLGAVLTVVKLDVLSLLVVALWEVRAREDGVGSDLIRELVAQRLQTALLDFQTLKYYLLELGSLCFEILWRCGEELPRVVFQVEGQTRLLVLLVDALEEGGGTRPE